RALAGQPDALPVLDARRDPDRDRPGLPGHPGAAALRARVVDQLAGAAALPARLAERERALVAGHQPAAQTRRAGVRLGAHPGTGQRPGLVVLPPPLVVGQYVVGLGHLLEPGLGLAVARVLVRVQLTGELAVRLLDVRLAGVLGDAQRGVVVLLQEVLGAHRAP